LVPNQVKQLGFRFRTWGGKRRGAGRKRDGERPRVAHKTRPLLKRRLPVHVTTRLRRDVCQLRTVPCHRLLRRVFQTASARDGFRVVHFSLQGNHVHFLVEADDARALTLGMQGLNIRMARALNRLMCRKGRVFFDRYHAVILQTPRQTAHALHYVLHNRQHHAPDRYPPMWRDPFATTRAPLIAPETWLLREAQRTSAVSRWPA
jgi:REP element-mobilizing transposase RayT